jgi:tetratricopeptide (TPR) repeat protein
MKPSSHGELLMATAYLKLKQPQRAKALLDLARKRDPKNAAIFRAVANYHREQREYDQAIAILNSAPRKSPEILGDLGWTYELAGKKQESAAAYLQAADAAKQNISLQLSAAAAQLRVGDRPKAMSLLARAQSPTTIACTASARAWRRTTAAPKKPSASTTLPSETCPRWCRRAGCIRC